MAEWFENWFDSEYYHQLYLNRSEVEADQFVEKLYTFLNPAPNSSLLDLACGKGRHAKAFAKHPLQVTGLDLSSNSIDTARKFETQNLEFYVHDMRTVFRINYYDFICNLFTSFGYFASSRDNHNAARSIAAGLKKGGIFVFDFVNKAHALNNIESNPSEEVTRGEISFLIKRFFQNNQFKKEIKIIDGLKELVYTESVNSFTLEQIKSLFSEVGLTMKQTFGNYQLDAYNELNSPRMILVFKKN